MPKQGAPGMEMSSSDRAPDDAAAGAVRTTTVAGPAHNTSLSRTELLLIFAFWTFMAVLTAANRLGDPRGPVLVGGTETTSIVLAFAQSYLWALLTPGIFIIASRYGIDRSNVASRVILFILLGVLCAFVVDQLMTALQRQALVGDGPLRGGGGGGRRGGPGAFGGGAEGGFPLGDGPRRGGPGGPRGGGQGERGWL